MTLAVAVAVIILCLYAFGPRPRLDSTLPGRTVPTDLPLRELARWLDDRERGVPGIIDGAAACIQFHDPGSPKRTPLCFMYVHGFSATWRETAPVTENLAKEFEANALQVRLAGHGTEPETLTTPAEKWLASMIEAWQIATQLGDQVVIVATSNGAPLSIWLTHQPGVRGRLWALLFMSPNFGIRSKFDFLLTAPWSKSYIHWFIGRYRQWEPINPAQAKYWTHRYQTLALVEMQKMVDWVKQQDLHTYTYPLVMMVMKNDPTIDPPRALAAFDRWGGRTKQLIPVTIDPDDHQHVFAGDICAPKRTDWTVQQFAKFLRQLPPPGPR